MKKFIDIAIKFNKYSESLTRANKLKNQNGIYLRTAMLFYAYSKLTPENRTVQNGKNYLKENLELNLSSAAMSRNNSALIDLGLIELIQNKNDKRAKMAKLTTAGEKLLKSFE